ncbi:MAG TPA: hypothetical protein VF612_11190 [Jatrophihabitans sp.]|jgi:hypothetical protein|uniref:hypothetical protein n=1 Tax=Jatrophihabitans sp. TaxID=1932789 RepID=UPI002F25D8AB
MSSPRVFGLPHLSEDAVAAFADGVLSAAAASRAQRHCAECAECADAVRGQREAAMMLRAAQAPALPSGLLDRLNGLPMSAPLPPPSRGGLPTVLGADGTAMFIAHDVRKARAAGHARQPHEPAQPPDETQLEAQPPAQTQFRTQPPAPARRRVALPMTVLASAAAVVAAGTLGGQVSTLAASADRQVQSGAANAAGSVTGGQTLGSGTGSPLAGAGSLLPADRSPAGPASTSTGPASTSTDPASRPALALGGPSSMTLAPLRRPAQQARTAIHRSALTTAPAQHVEWSSTGFAAPMAGAPTATP